jgi:hypothetical protein
MIVAMNQAGQISTQTMYAELKRRGTLAPDLDYDDEAELIAQEGGGLGMVEPEAEAA